MKFYAFSSALKSVTLCSPYEFSSSATAMAFLANRDALLMRSVFFFSSRRRHTRFDCDWSSDVCSSDLTNGSLLEQYRKRISTIYFSDHSPVLKAAKEELINGLENLLGKKILTRQSMAKDRKSVV